MRIKFCGTRGSIPKAGPSTVRDGGNTSCVELRSAGGTLIVLDCGSGAHGLGQSIMRTYPENCSGHMLITHSHWDHIQGLPFFAPLFGRFSTDKLKGLGFGLLYGVIWWFLGPLILMPLLLGMGTMLSLQGMQMALPSLLGHLIFGGILGVLYPVTQRRIREISSLPRAQSVAA